MPTRGEVHMWEAIPRIAQSLASIAKTLGDHLPAIAEALTFKADVDDEALAGLSEAPRGLRTLAECFDSKIIILNPALNLDPDEDDEVQRDLRLWADKIESLTERIEA